MRTPDLASANVEKIAGLFPHCVTEAHGADGELQRKIDWDLLRQELSSDLIQGAEERYRLDWPGKRQALYTGNMPINKTLRPCRSDSVDFDRSENLFIEGDNLDVLKLLRHTYMGKVKMIYIDPPYNTGKDFIYRDNYATSRAEYLRSSSQVDDAGNRLVANNESNGRFHSDWLSMMYPRLRLAQELLRDDGVIFISIDDNEQASLKRLCDEVFGEANFRNAILVKRGAKSVQAQFDTWDKLGQGSEYILFYSKNSTYRFPKIEKELENYKPGYWNNHWRGTDRPTMRYELLGIMPKHGQWRWSKQRSLSAIKNYQLMLSETQNTEESIKEEDIDRWYHSKGERIDLLRLSSNNKPEHFIPPTDSQLLTNVWFDLTSGGSFDIKNLMPTKLFNNPKSVNLLKRIFSFTSSSDIVLDFFSGSATTAHAVMQLNAEDGGNRKFIMVQLPEACDPKSEAYKAGYKTIADIGRERIRRAGAKILAGECHEGWNKDVGFRSLLVDSSNMNNAYYSPAETQQGQLDLWAREYIKLERSGEDLLFQVLLDWGLGLTLPIERQQICGLEVFIVDDNQLVACFAQAGEIDDELFYHLAKLRPRRALFRSSGLTVDSTQTNAEQIFGLISPSTEIKIL